MEYIFILGRNPELSIMELQSFFGKFEYKQVRNAILVSLPELDKGIINRFGGVIAIGKVMKPLELEPPESNKLNYVILDFTSSNHMEEVRGFLKKRYKEESVRATEKKIAGNLKLQSGEEVLNLSSKRLIDEQYFVFEEKFGRITEVCNYEELEKRDMEKPVRREKLAISPRLAKIMINLSKAKPGDVLLDPFCGIGVIVQEALRLGMNTIGIDKDSEAIEGIKKNLAWEKFPQNRYQLINGDSRFIKIKRANVVVSEPDLGKVLGKVPSEQTAREMLKEYEKLIIIVLKNFKKSVSGRIVLTAPFIQTNKKRLRCNKEKIIEQTGLKLVEGFPIEEFRKDQIVAREIFVFEN
jgi:tRNA G10  N-methylase Trm11